MSFLYLVMDSPVTGWMTGAQKCLHNHGIAWDVVRGAYVWMRSAFRAACVYSRGVRSAMRGDLRGAVGSGVLVGSSVGVGASVGAGSVVGGVVGPHVGGRLFRVSL